MHVCSTHNRTKIKTHDNTHDEVWLWIVIIYKAYTWCSSFDSFPKTTAYVAYTTWHYLWMPFYMCVPIVNLTQNNSLNIHIYLRHILQMIFTNTCFHILCFTESLKTIMILIITTLHHDTSRDCCQETQQFTLNLEQKPDDE